MQDIREIRPSQVKVAAMDPVAQRLRPLSWLLAGLALLAVAQGVARGQELRPLLDVQRYDIEARLDPQARSLEATTSSHRPT